MEGNERNRHCTPLRVDELSNACPSVNVKNDVGSVDRLNFVALVDPFSSCGVSVVKRAT